MKISIWLVVSHALCFVLGACMKWRYVSASNIFIFVACLIVGAAVVYGVKKKHGNPKIRRP